MSTRTHEQDERIEEGGFGGLLRGLLAGIPWSERAEADEVLRFAAPHAGLLRIENPNGRTRILGEDRGDVEAHVHKMARAETEEAARQMALAMRLAAHDADGALELGIEIPKRWNRRGTADIELRVPRALAVEVSVSNGKVCAHGLRGSLRAHSSNGAARIEDVQGEIEVQASNAKVWCSDTCGRLVARTSNGKVHIENHGGSLDASTSNGLIQAELTELGAEGCVLATSNGRIVLTLPDEVDADVDLRVDNGVVRNHRPLCRCTRSSGGRVAGVLGRGGAPIRLRTSNGSISLK